MNVLIIAAFLCLVCSVLGKQKATDPKECEVCISNLDKIAGTLDSKSKRSEKSIVEAIGNHCTKTGFGSEWVPNPALKNPKDVKMCYIFEPIKKAVAVQVAMGKPKAKVCQVLRKDNPDICDIRYPIKIEKKEGEKVNYGKMRVKELKKLLDQRGAKCTGCTEKQDYVAKCEETEHLDL